jgi:DNA polymerase alpha subunit A
MSGRSRREIKKPGGAGVAAALQQLNAARAGTKRLDTFELKEETAVYEVVDDEQYAQLVTKRRIEAGGCAA